MTDMSEVAQAVRRSHCSHEERGQPGHQCVGVCKIGPRGVELECGTCGNDTHDRAPDRAPATVLAREILEAAGLQWDALSPDAQARAVAVARRTFCSFCGRRHAMPDSRYDKLRCACGAVWESSYGFSGGGWTRKEDA